MCPAPPVSTHTPLQLPAEAASSFWLVPNQGTLIRVRHLNHRLTTGTGYHSGRHTPCAVIPVLHYSSHVGRTTLRPKPARHVRSSRSGIVSGAPPRADFD